MKQIYMDHAATTPMHQEAVGAMIPVFQEDYGNPSSVHAVGRRARQLLDQARTTAAASIHADVKEIIFTSGGTEADNLAIIGTALANKESGNHIITTKQEHHAALHATAYLERNGFEVTYLPVYENGQISVDDVRAALRPETILVTVMYVNNETGVKQPIDEIGDLLRNHQAYFHTDAVQAYGLININVKQQGIDLLTVSSHKINGPKGVGFLFVNQNLRVEPLQHGGEQERKKRAGTENVAGIVGFSKAIELAMKQKEDKQKHYTKLMKHFIDCLTDEQIMFHINGDRNLALPTIINISFPGTQVEALLMNIDLSGIAASSGSACTAGSVEPSHVLTAMYGSENERAKNSIRFSLGLYNTMDEMKEAAERIGNIMRRLTRKR
ncbi:cysteine desulfurase [Ornithinibacillus gellani]|uniref:cysteine desulfurase family protein n=1 Tax=Ornithinibacillus gellani TaxID=2293253 RepID=UPI000F4818EC|nr:cysteine desulfurase family protein [Ornithinibacillus gellani]TQS74650.1 cysteine desulfurase [Ornithinibacillus gellani]